MGHRINPVGLRLNIMQSWDTLAPSKSTYINDFFFKHFFLMELYNFFKLRWYSDLEKRFILRLIKRIQYFVYKRSRLKSKLLKQLLFYRYYFKDKKAIRQRESKLFFLIHDFFIGLNKNNFQLDYCFFQKVCGLVTLKLIFKISFLESEFFNYLRISQKWFKTKLFSLNFFKISNYHPRLKLVNKVLYNTLYLFDFKYKQSYYFLSSSNYATSFYYLYNIFMTVTLQYVNFYMRNINFLLYFMRRHVLTRLAYLKVYKYINIEFSMNSFSFLSSNLYSKYIQYRLAKYESVARVIYSFFFIILKILKKLRNLQAKLHNSFYNMRYYRETFYLTDSFIDFSGFTEIFGLKIFTSGRFTKKRRVRGRKFYKGAIPLNFFHKNVILSSSNVRLKFGISGVKLWVYKAPSAKYIY